MIPVEGVLVGSDRYVAGSFRVDEGRITDLGCGDGGDAGRNRIAIPGLRNAHSHLDLSLLDGVPRARSGFAAWILDLLARRGATDAEGLGQGALSGARQALASGTTAIGDIDASGESYLVHRRSGLRGISFREVLGRDASTSMGVVREWREGTEGQGPSRGVRPGISPHAPYSAAAGLFRACQQAASDDRLKLTSHVAETLAESELFRSGEGELAKLLGVLGVPPPFELPPGCSPIRHLLDLGCLGPELLLAHANYPEDGDLELLADSGASVVFCPRSHNFFGHSRHPVRRYLDRGIPVALGTDSLASNRSLSLLDEMAFLRVSRPDLLAAEVFEMATVAGARFLEDRSGRLEPGEPADLVILEMAAGKTPNGLEEALEQVTAGASRVVATIVSGMVCYASDDAEGSVGCLTWAGSELFSPVSGRRFDGPPDLVPGA